MLAPHSQGRRSSNSSQGGRCIISLSFHTQNRTVCTCREPQPCRTVGELADILLYFSASPALPVRTASCSFSLTGASRRKDYSSLPSCLEATKQTCRPKKTQPNPSEFCFSAFSMTIPSLQYTAEEFIACSAGKTLFSPQRIC